MEHNINRGHEIAKYATFSESSDAYSSWGIFDTTASVQKAKAKTMVACSELWQKPVSLGSARSLPKQDEKKFPYY